MKFFFSFVSAPALALAFFVDPASAQLIDINQNPSAIADVTSYDGEGKMQVLAWMSFAIMALGLLAPFVGIAFIVSLIMVCFKNARKTGKKILLFSGIGIGIIILVIVGFALVTTFSASDVSNRALPLKASELFF